MKFLFSAIVFVFLSACASTPAPERKVAAQDQTGTVSMKGHAITYRFEDRGWEARTNTVQLGTDAKGQSPTVQSFTSIEADKSYLMTYEAPSAAAYNAIKVEAGVAAGNQCTKFGEEEKVNPANQVAGFKTSVSAKIVNHLELASANQLRFVCIVSVLAAKN